MIIGGAGGPNVFGSWLMMISPGAGGVGGRKYLMASSFFENKI
jgi:hypothetical protein